LAGRFLVLRLTKSFFGREDTRLTEKLLAERPGIVSWTIDGWQRLRQRGHFVLPQSANDGVSILEDLASPVGAFVREECIVGAGCRISLDNLYEAWKSWCERDGRNTATTKQRFGRDLAAAVPGLVRRRGTGMQPFYEGVSLRPS
jgi:putative DNA primase/helicase